MNKAFIILIVFVIFSNFVIFSQSLEEHIFYAPKAENFTSLVILNSEDKILTNMEDILLMDKKNLIIDTLSIRSKLLKKDQIFEIFVIDDFHFNAVCNNSSYLISVGDNRFNIVKKVEYSDRKHYGKFSHLYLTHEYEIVIQHENKLGQNKLIFKIFENSTDKKNLTEISYKGTFNKYTSIIYNFPVQYFHHKNLMIYPNSFDNSLYIINLKNGELKKLDLLPYDLNNGSQTVFLDRATKKYYMLRAQKGEDNNLLDYSLFSMDINLNEYNKLKEFSNNPSSFRGGIFNGKFIMTGSFNDESAWFTVPISEIDQYKSNLKLYVDE